MDRTRLLDEEGFRRTISRLTHEVLEANHGAERLVIVGIRTRGDYLAHRLAKKIAEIEGTVVPVGCLDITLYRDDLRGKLEQPHLKSTDILFDLSGKTLVLVDDVLFTGRTIRAALNAIMDIGRPATIQLMVLIDRGHRELPIKADFVGKNVPTSSKQSVQVLMAEIDNEDGVYLKDAT